MINLSLYIITDSQLAGQRSLTNIIQQAIRGGATVVQLREKHASTRQMVKLGLALHEITRKANIPLIVNDRVDVTLAIDAEGVHLGQDDMRVTMARRLLGKEKIIGVSVSTVGQARQAEADGATYLGVGDVFGTTTKPNAGIPIGLDGLRRIVSSVSIPAVGIGGITEKNAAEVIRAGAAGIAVISAIIGAKDPELTAKQLCAIITKTRQRMRK